MRPRVSLRIKVVTKLATKGQNWDHQIISRSHGISLTMRRGLALKKPLRYYWWVKRCWVNKPSSIPSKMISIEILGHKVQYVPTDSDRLRIFCFQSERKANREFGKWNTDSYFTNRWRSLRLRCFVAVYFDDRYISGVNVPDHAIMFERIISKLGPITKHVAVIWNRDSNNVRTIVEESVSQLMNVGNVVSPLRNKYFTDEGNVNVIYNIIIRRTKMRMSENVTVRCEP